MSRSNANLRISGDDEMARKFQVHKNYIGGIAHYIENEFGRPGSKQLESIIEEQRSKKSFRKIQRKKVDSEKLNRYLTLSLASELQFRLATITDDHFLKYSNAWAPIHAYYAIYMSLHSWLLCLGADIIDSHTSSLNYLSNQIKQRNLFPLPWSVTCSGCPHLKECQYHGIPNDANLDDDFEVLSNPTLENFWSRYSVILKTTRKRRLERNINSWKEQRGRLNTYAHEKRQIDNNLPATTIFDFFWRLRMRSNYGDVKSFLLSDVSDSWQTEFWNSLEATMNTTIALLQSLVVAYSGKDIFKKAMDDFLKGQHHEIETIEDPYKFRLYLLTD